MQNSRTHSWRFSRLRTRPWLGSPSVHEFVPEFWRRSAFQLFTARPSATTARSILTMPLGVRAGLHAEGPRHARNPRTGGHRMTQAQLNTARPLQGKHIHVIGIGGSAMAPLGGMLPRVRFPSHRIRFWSLSSRVHAARQPRHFVFSHLSQQHISRRRPDLVIVGTSIARGNPELEETLERKIPYRSMPEILEEVVSSRQTLHRYQRLRTEKPPAPRCWRGFSILRRQATNFSCWRYSGKLRQELRTGGRNRNDS